mgnify:CR=1 FL=1
MAKKSVSQGNLNVTNSAELLSYVINQTPELRENLKLPVQGESIKGIGKIIMKLTRLDFLVKFRLLKIL